MAGFIGDDVSTNPVSEKPRLGGGYFAIGLQASACYSDTAKPRHIFSRYGNDDGAAWFVSHRHCQQCAFHSGSATDGVGAGCADAAGRSTHPIRFRGIAAGHGCKTRRRSMSGGKVLVVEDSAIIALDLSSQLAALGYDVVGIASSGEDALRQIECTRPDVALMDISLGGTMDGIETASRIAPGADLAVIYLTGSSEETTLRRARETKPYGYLIKPFSERELHATLQMALELRRAAADLRSTERRLEAANHALQTEVAARVRSEQEIRRERDMAQRYLDVAGVMILSLDRDGFVTLINSRGCAILQYAGPEGILGRNWIGSFVPDYLQGDLRKSFESLKRRKTASLEFEQYPVLTKFKAERMIAWRTTLLADDEGCFSGLLCSGDDITERYLAEADQRRLAAIVESSDAAIIGNDLDGTVTSWNRAAERIFGYPAREMLGEPISRLAMRDHPQEMDDLIARVARGEHISQLETITCRKDGSAVPILLAASPICDASGKVVGVSKIAADISELQHARAEREALVADLRNTQEQLLDAQRISRIGHWKYDRGQNRFWISSRVAELFGIMLTNLWVEAEDFFAFAHPDDRDLLRDAVGVSATTSVLNVEHRIQLADGSVRWMLERADHDGQQGASPNVIGTVQDITERKSFEARLHEMQAELLHVSRLSAMGQMTSTLAHEVNQPLAAISNYIRAGLLMLGSPDPSVSGRVRAVFEKAAHQAGRVSDVVANLREFVRKGETSQRLEDLDEVIADAITLAQMGAIGSGIAIQLDLLPDARFANINRVQIQQVLVNLLRNAMEAMVGGRRRITISTRRSAADTIEVGVADTGPGVSQNINDDLFRPFVTTKSEGMGVGLAICQSIVDAHGGRIWASPNAGGGAVFNFTVPAATKAS
jgi:two-component system sensor kinase FixL